MKKYDRMMMWGLLFFVAAAALFPIWFWRREPKENLQYKVEINEIMTAFQEQGGFLTPALKDKNYITEVSFLPIEKVQDAKEVTAFSRNKNGQSSTMKPLVAGGQLLGVVRFDYQSFRENHTLFWVTEGILVISGGLLMFVLFFVRNKIVKPFNILQDMPYELAKGHLKGELKESRSRFFGKFIWGISMLRDTLQDAKAKELKLEKEKKLLLLSISHDIKIPLSTVKLYAKALQESVYDTEEKKLHAARQIEKHALEIEGFVKEIITASSEEIVSVEVENGEFYLKDYLERIRQYYEPKCRLAMTEFQIGAYANSLIKGDLDKALEVMENIIENAFKYGDGRRITIDFYEEDYCQIVRVSSTGNAVKSEEMPHLFDSFFRGSNIGAKEGNGLGLYIGRQIMRKMDGDLFAVREEDGMSFHLVFGMM